MPEPIPESSQAQLMRTGERLPGRWSQRQRDLAVVLWVAFLVAAFGTVALFALLDPERLGQAWVPDWETSVRLTYGIGFLCLFLACAVAGLLCAYMIRSGPPTGHARGQAGRPPPHTHDPAEGNPDLAGQTWE